MARCQNLSPDGDKSNWPLQRGFDRFYGTIIGAGSFYDPWTLTRGNQAITPENDPEYQPETFYYTHAISDQAARFVQEHDSEEPFFMYVAYTAPHWPLHALEKDIEKYKGRYRAGHEAIRKARYQRMKQLGVIQENWPLSPAPRAWSELSEDEKAWEARAMEVYAAMIDSMDQGIGRIVETLKRKGIFENTLIAHWPEGISAKNELRHRPGHVVDLMATCLEVSGAQYPKVFADHRIQPLEGLSLVPSFAKDEAPDRVLLFEHLGRAAIRDDKWKLVRLGENKPWELYDLEKDRSEMNNLAAEHPEIAKELEELWIWHAWRTRVFPKPGGGK